MPPFGIQTVEAPPSVKEGTPREPVTTVTFYKQAAPKAINKIAPLEYARE